MKRKTPHKQARLHPCKKIITDILLRLPVKSLLRFKYTSKSWRSLISSKHFVKTHLENSTKNPPFACHRIISVTREGNKYDIQHCSLHPLFPERVTYASYGDFPVDESVDSLRLLGSCNGLVCISINETKYFLWNPSARESKKLPDFDLKILSHSHIIEDGFGFDESSGDYKVYAASYDQLQDIAKIYSLKQDSWTRINYNNKDVILSPRTGKFVSGNLHWIRVIEDEWYISSLDLKNGVYGIVERPSILDDHSSLVLGVLNGCLSAFCCSQDCKYLDLWVLKQYGVKDSWSKMMRISDNLFMDYMLLTPLDIISQNREVLFRYRWDLVVYKLKENRFWYLKTNGFKNLHKLVHVESLVSVMANIEE
ncbi:hypothetical protein CDL12_19486 [Handroanthus impetiginosus]|uniref:F-box domain-containing protein n=1 Tax=Handroanthus impetiginosus TaxID=429701 RepID=A0A2G9GRM7_9LAMI|nr:hypothetical protein CDL12_19486 [Handroanthus impetiginosus]